MSRARKRRTRKLRRKASMVLRSGVNPSVHKLQSGRTGSVFAKRLRSRKGNA
jgi:hypothetical protein